MIPVVLRKQLGLTAGDTIVFSAGQDDQEVVIRRRQTWDEMSARFHSWIRPGIEPLEDVHQFYESREPRV